MLHVSTSSLPPPRKVKSGLANPMVVQLLGLPGPQWANKNCLGLHEEHNEFNVCKKQNLHFFLLKQKTATKTKLVTCFTLFLWNKCIRLVLWQWLPFLVSSQGTHQISVEIFFFLRFILDNNYPQMYYCQKDSELWSKGYLSLLR